MVHWFEAHPQEPPPHTPPVGGPQVVLDVRLVQLVALVPGWHDWHWLPGLTALFA